MELPLPSLPPGTWVAPGTCQGSATPHWWGQWGDNGETVGDGREVSSGDEGEEAALPLQGQQGQEHTPVGC